MSDTEIIPGLRSGSQGAMRAYAASEYRRGLEDAARIAETRPTMDPNMPDSVKGLEEMYITVGMIVGRKIAAAIRALSRDSDASLAEDAKRLSPEGVVARAEGIAQNAADAPEHTQEPTQ